MFVNLETTVLQELVNAQADARWKPLVARSFRLTIGISRSEKLLTPFSRTFMNRIDLLTAWWPTYTRTR